LTNHHCDGIPVVETRYFRAIHHRVAIVMGTTHNPDTTISTFLSRFILISVDALPILPTHLPAVHLLFFPTVWCEAIHLYYFAWSFDPPLSLYCLHLSVPRCSSQFWQHFSGFCQSFRLRVPTTSEQPNIWCMPSLRERTMTCMDQFRSLPFIRQIFPPRGNTRSGTRSLQIVCRY